MLRALPSAADSISKLSSVELTGFRVCDLGFEILDLGFWLLVVFRVQGLGFWVWGSGLRFGALVFQGQQLEVSFRAVRGSVSTYPELFVVRWMPEFPVHQHST